MKKTFSLLLIAAMVAVGASVTLAQDGNPVVVEKPPGIELNQAMELDEIGLIGGGEGEAGIVDRDLGSGRVRLDCGGGANLG